MSTIAAPHIAPSLTNRWPTADSPKPARLVSLDAYRGLVMILMAAEMVRLPETARHFPHSAAWHFIGDQFDHVRWAGCAIWDLIQPSFMFMVGVALPFSLARRRADGQSFARMFAHALWRSALLIAVAIFLGSIGQPRTDWAFTNVLAQIALGYPFLFLLAWLRPRWQVTAVVVILVGHWLAYVTYPAPRHVYAIGLLSHWEKNLNLGTAFDRWFLNLFPRRTPWRFSPGGYSTLNFIPSLATMVLGLMAGSLLRSERPAGSKIKALLIAGAAGLLAGSLLELLRVCPIVKRQWTPAWVLFAAAWTCWTLAAFYAVIDVARVRGWAFPLVVVGMNSIAMYCMAHQPFSGFVRDSLVTHLGRKPYLVLGEPFFNLLLGAAALVMLWLICFWMYRRKIFLRL
jgi:predicted acyltransferase